MGFIWGLYMDPLRFYWGIIQGYVGFYGARNWVISTTIRPATQNAQNNVRDSFGKKERLNFVWETVEITL